jgi:hypothetical protein
MSRHKDRCNGEQVVSEFLSTIFFTDDVPFTVNHEFRANLFEDGLQQVAPEATESVFVQDHNLFDQPIDDAFQNGRKTFPFEVEAATDVCDKLVCGVRFLQLLALSCEVGSLVCG